MTALSLENIVGIIKDGYQKVYGDDIIEIYLYGSYARGDYDSESDVDFVAIVRGERPDLQRKLKKMWELSTDLSLENDVIISPTVIPYNEFIKYQSTLPYYRNILKEGQKVG